MPQEDKPGGGYYLTLPGCWELQCFVCRLLACRINPLPPGIGFQWSRKTNAAGGPDGLSSGGTEILNGEALVACPLTMMVE